MRQRRKETKKILDINYAKKFTNPQVRTTLKKTKTKGTSIFAKKKISKGSIIAYYKFLVVDTKNYNFFRDGEYAMTVYTKKYKDSQKYTGDIFPGSLEMPKYNVPFWGYFSNEPTPRQKYNAYLDVNLKENYRHRNSVKEGDTMVYKIRASRDIHPGEEIMWCYGIEYIREYKSSCNV